MRERQVRFVSSHMSTGSVTYVLAGRSDNAVKNRFHILRASQVALGSRPCHQASSDGNLVLGRASKQENAGSETVVKTAGKPPPGLLRTDHHDAEICEGGDGEDVHGLSDK